MKNEAKSSFEIHVQNLILTKLEYMAIYSFKVSGKVLVCLSNIMYQHSEATMAMT